MPKKQRLVLLAKPGNGYVHPSLSTGASSGQAMRDASNPPSSSVNGYLQHLRRTQAAAEPSEHLRTSRHATPTRNTRVAGPPAPRSWTVSTSDGSSNGPSDLSHGYEARRPRSLRMFPESRLPSQRSLLHHVLRSTAIDIDWHFQYDHEFLCLLSLEIRYRLLSYTAMYGPDTGMTVAGLKRLFPDARSSVASCDDVKQLDLTGAIGRGISPKSLLKYWLRRETVKSGSTQVVDCWEELIDLEDMNNESTTLSLSPTPRFPNLTHLSLSRPAQHVSWNDLLSLSSYLGSLTHLALDHWPRPGLPEAQEGESPVQARDAKEEASFVLSTLSRNTPSLVWLSLAQCQDWTKDLQPGSRQFGNRDEGSSQARSTRHTVSRSRGNSVARHRWSEEENWSEGVAWSSKSFRQPMDRNAYDGPDWSGSWQRVKYVNLSQGWVPAGLKLVDAVGAHSGFSSVDHVAHIRNIREPEAYRVIVPSSEMQVSMQERSSTIAWLVRESLAGTLASEVKSLRRLLGQPGCTFDHGWKENDFL